MDPNETLRELRELAPYADGYGSPEGWLERGGEVFKALDDWLARGGFLPEAWQAPTAATSAGLADTDRAEYRLALRFERAIGDDEALDRFFSMNAERQRLARLLAHEVILEVAEERAQLEASMSAAVTEQFLSNLRRQLEGVGPDPTGVPQGFTPEGWARLNQKRAGL
jgi:hypothetical protein